MLILSRRIGETIVLPSCEVTIQVVEVSRSRVKLGVTAPGEIAVHRGEVASRIALEEGLNSKPKSEPIARVLIADPEPTRLESYRQFLAGKGLEVATATTGLECVGRLRNSAPDALVLHYALLWGGATGVLALMYDPRGGLPRVPVVVQGGRLACAGAGGNGRPRMDRVDRLLAPSEVAERIHRLLQKVPAPSGAAPGPSYPTKLDARLASWIRQRAGGRIHGLRVERQAGRVVVHGCARTYYARQLAQQAAREVLAEAGTERPEEVVVDIEVTAS
jgi:carbon storage regulator